MLDEYNYPVKRKVWENKKGSKLLTVTGLLEEGEYKFNKEEKDDGTIIIRATPTDE